MSKSKAQGTAFETAFVRRAQDHGLLADRLAEGGLNDAGDVWVNDTPKPGGRDIVAVAWSRLVNTGTGRRSADGARAVVVLSMDDFFTMITNLATAVDSFWAEDIAFVIECKATERLNVTRELADAQKKLDKWKGRKK